MMLGRKPRPFRWEPRPELLLGIKIPWSKLSHYRSMLGNSVSDTQLKIKDEIITLVPSGHSLTRLLNLTTRTIKRPTRTLLQNPTPIIIINNNIISTVLRLAGSGAIPVEQRSLSIVNNVTGDVPSFSIQLPNTNPGKAHTPTPVHRTPLHLLLTCLFHKLLPPVPRARAPITP
ncbi:hypothetical protein V8G54_002092, partial [Vigna mungo]